ncbi:MAG: hypothetical protein AAFV93_06840 [Chloroflexota bacterium]
MKQARRYIAPEGVEVAGTTTLSFVDNISGDSISEFRSKHGLSNIDTNQWYPLQQVFDLFNDIAQELSTQAFVAMGMKIAEQSEFPPEMLGNELSLVQILEGWQAHYEANHRGGDLPPVETIKVADTHYQLVFAHNHAYPYDLVYGLAYGFCKLLLPKGSQFMVAYDEQLSPMQKSETDNVIVNITWGDAL